MEINILITSASRKVSLVKSFQNALKQEGGGKVLTVDVNPLSPALFHSDLSYLVPRDSHPSFISAMLELCKKHRIKLLIPTRDEELKIFADNKDRFEKIGTKIMVPSSKTVEICLDKLKFVEFCKENKLPVPKTYTLKQAKSRSVKFPLFVNDRFGKSSKKAFKVRSQNELDLLLSYIERPIIQEYIEEKEYTIDIFTDFSGNVISVIPRERIYILGGESFIGKTYKNEKLIKSVIELSKKLNLIGHNTVQCFFGKSGLKFIEVNPRYGGGANLGFAAGANTPLYLIQLLKGKKLQSQIGNFKDGLIMLRYTEDLFVAEDKINKIERFYG